jgi:hypothetical protein
MHVAQPVKGAKGMSSITIISQVNTHSRSPAWLLAFTGESGSRALGVLHKDDLVRELKTTGAVLTDIILFYGCCLVGYGHNSSTIRPWSVP